MLRAAEQDSAETAATRQNWRVMAAGIASERLVFIDERAALTNLVRLYARSRRGERARGAAPFGHWTRLTVLAALGTEEWSVS